MQIVKQFLEHAVELKAKEDLRAQDQEAIVIDRGLELSFKRHGLRARKENS
jgi:hypothetical protein